MRTSNVQLLRELVSLQSNFLEGRESSQFVSKYMSRKDWEIPGNYPQEGESGNYWYLGQKQPKEVQRAKNCWPRSQKGKRVSGTVGTICVCTYLYQTVLAEKKFSHWYLLPKGPSLSNFRHTGETVSHLMSCLLPFSLTEQLEAEL